MAIKPALLYGRNLLDNKKPKTAKYEHSGDGNVAKDVHPYEK